VVNAQGGTGLFGKEELEGVGTEVENGSAKNGFGHRKV
jgi:hypothetical protein